MRLSQPDAGGYVNIFFIEDGHKKFRCGGQNWMRAAMINKRLISCGLKSNRCKTINILAILTKSLFRAVGSGAAGAAMAAPLFWPADKNTKNSVKLKKGISVDNSN